MVKDTVIVIFGCRHREEYLSRIDKATASVLKKQIHPIHPIYIFTGIDPLPFPPNTTAEFLKNDRIILENESTDTESNIKNTLEVIGARILNWYDIFIVSSWYHIPRIKLLLRRKGVRIPKQNFIKSYDNIQVINILVEPFAFLAAFFRINHWPTIIRIKHLLGYNV